MKKKAGKIKNINYSKSINKKNLKIAPLNPLLVSQIMEWLHLLLEVESLCMIPDIVINPK